jgi:hypothetical protein
MTTTTTAPKTGLRAQPEFESMEDETLVADTSVMDAALAIAKAAADAAPANVPAVAPTNTTVGPVVKRAGFQAAFQEQDNFLSTIEVQELALAAPTIKGEQGSFFIGTKELGDEIHVELVSFNPRWAIGCGEDNKESKDFFRVSYDGRTIHGEGTSIEDYMDDLRAQGFEHPKMSIYKDIWVLLTWSKLGGDVALEDQEIMRLQASQTSAGAFGAYSKTQGLLESKGIRKASPYFGVRAMKRSKGDFKYTNFEFFTLKAA